MDESEWLTSGDPAAMLRFCTDEHSNPKATFWPIGNRRLRLWVEACRAALDAASGFATVWRDLDRPGELKECVETWGRTTFWDHRVPKVRRANLLREVIGNPFRPVVLPQLYPGRHVMTAPGVMRLKVTGPAYCPWLTPTAFAIARTAYEDRDWTLLPILADELDSAGATDAALLGHLRGKEPDRNCRGGTRLHLMEFCDSCGGTGWVALRGPHVRGCWAIDLILGKE